MTEIFISQRREDSAPCVARLNDRLRTVYGSTHVFVDAEGVAPGQNFMAVLHQKIEAAQVLLVLIGPKWLSAAHTDGSRRLDDPYDFVRFELVETLRLNKRVIPILINATPMPEDRDLPVDLQALAACPPMPLSDARFERDLANLLQALAGTASPGRRRGLVALGMSVAAVVALIGWQVIFHTSDQPVVTPMHPDADIVGTWQGAVVYERDQGKVTERFSFKNSGGVLTGSASFLGVPRDILMLELKGNALRFETHTKGSIKDREVETVHHYRGTVMGGQMHLEMQTTGGHETVAPVEIVAQRVSRD